MWLGDSGKDIVCRKEETGRLENCDAIMLLILPSAQWRLGREALCLCLPNIILEEEVPDLPPNYTYIVNSSSNYHGGAVNISSGMNIIREALSF